MKPRAHREEYRPEDDSRYIAEKVFKRRHFSTNDRIDLDRLLIKINEGYYLDPTTRPGPKNARY